MSNDILEMAGAFILAGELDEALALINQHISAHPDDPAARRLRIAVVARLPVDEITPEVLDDFAHITDPTPADYVRQIRLLLMRADRMAALDLAAEAHGRFPSVERVTELYLTLLHEDGQVTQMRTILGTLPADWRWLRVDAGLAAEAGDFARAVEQFSAALTHLAASIDTEQSAFAANIKAQLLIGRADAHAAAGSVGAAEADLTAAEQIVPGDPGLVFKRGLLAAQQGDLARAVELCGAALSAAPAALSDMLTQTLHSDPNYAALAALLLSGDVDG